MAALSNLPGIASSALFLLGSGACGDTAGPVAPPAVVSIADSSATLVPGDTLTLRATVFNSDSSELTERRVRWASSDTTIATVSRAGLISARADGLAWVYAASGSVADSTAILVVDPFTATQITAGASSTCALQAGQGYCWGSNLFQQLGTGLLGGRMGRPTPIAGGLSWTTITLSNYHGCGVATSGSAYCWGENDQSQLGDSTYTGRAVPVLVKEFDSLSSLGLRLRGSCGIRTPGSVVCWGEGAAAFITGNQIQASPYHSCAWLTDGPATCWGSNLWGQLGDGSTTYYPFGVAVAGGLPFRIVSPGEQFTCGLTPGAETLCWGDNGYGQLGDGTTAGHLTPTPVSVATEFTFIDAGYYHACGLTAQGEAWCWGANFNGQLGDGTTTDRTAPVRVTGGRKFMTLSAGERHTCGITTSGQVFCWGGNLFGDYTNNLTPLPVPKP